MPGSAGHFSREKEIYALCANVSLFRILGCDILDFFGSLLNPIVALIQSGIGVIYQMLSNAGFPNYGVAIILLTVIIKMILYPLTVKQIKSMKGLQELQPKMKKLQEQYKSNPQLLQQEMAKLYESAGINPLAGCLKFLKWISRSRSLKRLLIQHQIRNFARSFWDLITISTWKMTAKQITSTL